MAMENVILIRDIVLHKNMVGMVMYEVKARQNAMTHRKQTEVVGMRALQKILSKRDKTG